MRIAVKRKCGIRKLYEARRGSATVHGLEHTAHIKEQHKERRGWQVGVWQRVTLMLATWCTDGRGEESEVALKVGVRYCSRQCSRGESTRERDVVLALGGR
jgi:hypothetical protein